MARQRARNEISDQLYLEEPTQNALYLYGGLNAAAAGMETAAAGPELAARLPKGRWEQGTRDKAEAHPYVQQ